jgi:MFS family permease
MVVESWLNGAATEQTRGQILSVYGMTGLLAGILGQLLLPAADPAGFRPFCVIAIIIAIALVPIALTQAVAPTQQGGEIRISLRELYRQSPLGLVAAFLCGVTTSAFFTLGPIFAQRRGLDTGGVAVFMASGTLGGFLLTYPLGLLSDRLDRRLVIIGAAITAALTLLVLVAVVPKHAPPWIVYLCVALFGGTIVPTYSVVMAHVNDSVGEGEFVAASSGLLIVQGAGAVVGPLIAGLAMSFLQRGLSSTIITAQVLIVAFGVYRLRQRAAPSALQKKVFVVEPAIPVATTLQ